MAFETNTATGVNDLVNKLFIFANTNGWTQDELDLGATNRHGTLHRGSNYIHFGWTSTPTHLGIWHSLGFVNNTTDPWDHTDDAGGQSTFGDDDQRGVEDIGDGGVDDEPYTYWFFQDGDYLHAVIKLDNEETYRHFGAGILNKAGTWTGGEYCYGTNWDNATDPTASSSHCGLDGAAYLSSADNPDRAATLHIESFLEQDVTGKWASVWGGITANTPNDRAGNPRASVLGGVKGGPITHGLFWLEENGFSGYQPLIPITCWYVRDSVGVQRGLCYLGDQPDVRSVNMQSYTPEQEETIGADDWIFFPAIKKQSDNTTQESHNMGFAYKKVP